MPFNVDFGFIWDSNLDPPAAATSQTLKNQICFQARALQVTPRAKKVLEGALEIQKALQDTPKQPKTNRTAFL